MQPFFARRLANARSSSVPPVLFAIVTSALLLCACTTVEPGGDTGSTSTTKVAPPKITKAYFDPVVWNPVTNRYETTLHLYYPSTKGPLHLEGFYQWTIGADSGVKALQERDISKFARLADQGRHYVLPFWFMYRSEYVYTITLRYPGGRASVELPVLKVE